MIHSSHRNSYPRRGPLDAMADRLGPALVGYPVKELVELWAAVDDAEDATPGQLVERCLSSWIARLDVEEVALLEAGQEVDELRTRLRCARHALTLIRARFRRSTAHIPRGRDDRRRLRPTEN